MITEGFLHAMTRSPPPPRPQVSQGTGLSAAPPVGARILVVEDDYLVGLTIEDALVDGGYEFLGQITSGEEAVRQGPSLRPDLVLMDIRLAGPMTGIEAAVELRKAGLRCLFASAHSEGIIRNSADLAEPLGWLAKPFSADQLLAAVGAALAGLRRDAD